MKGKLVSTSKELIAFAYVQEEYKRTGDITIGLMPLFAPIIHELSGELFDPNKFALAVQAKYDLAMRPIVAKSLIPKLVETGLLIKEEKSEYLASYRCVAGPAPVSSTSFDRVEELLNKFAEFAAESFKAQKLIVPINDLKEGFIQRLKNIQCLHELHSTLQFSQMLSDEKRDDSTIEKGDADQISLALDILSAEFITNLAEKNPTLFDFLVNVVSGALIADVVLTLQQPAADTNLSGLTVVLDGPLIMDILDLNTTEFMKFAQDLLDLLKASHVDLVTFEHVVEEIRGSIYAPLVSYNRGENGYGPLAARLRQDPNHAAYARAVHDGLKDFIENLGITIVDAGKFTEEDYAHYCSDEIEDALRNCLGPLHDAVERRIRDAKSVASVIRMRKGHSSIASVTESKFIFITRNVQVARRTSDCLVSKGIIGYEDVPPCILDIQIAGVLWLCLGGSAEKLTREKLLANCMDVLYPRPNLLSTVRQFLQNLDPDKAKVFEALMRDKRAQRCLLHKTVGYTHAVTQDNVEELLEEIRRSTAQEIEHEAQQKEKIFQEEHDQQMAEKTAELNRTREDKEKLLKEKSELETKQDEIVVRVLERACKSAQTMKRRRKAIVIVIYGLLVLVTTYFSNKIGGLLLSILCGLVAVAGFWIVPDKLLRNWIDKAWQEKFADDLLKSKIEDYGRRFQLNKENCEAKKKEFPEAS